jgi:biotin operon repressor
MAIPSSGQHVRGVTVPRHPPVSVDWGLAYEALIGLALFVGEEAEQSYEVGEAWFKSVRRKASPGLRQAAKQLFGKQGYPVVGLAGLAQAAGARRVSALVARIRRDRSGQVKRAMLHCDPPLRDAILRGEEAAKREYLKGRKPGERELAKRLLEANPNDLATATADLIERWDSEIFSAIGPPLESDLEASWQTAARLSRQLPSDRLILKVTKGVEYRPEPWVQSIVLTPSILNRPWVDITDHDGIAHIFYPASPDASTPDAELVEVYKALGDETRLRILRLLSTGVTSLSDLAEKLGLAKSTVHGHMVILRTAGLTRSVVGGDGKGYVLNDRPDLNSLLDTFLKS